MSPIDCLGVSWPALCAQVSGSNILSSWATVEPALACVETVEELARLVQERVQADRADVLLGALVRLGAHDGGDDEAAAMVVSHLLAPGARCLAYRLRDLSADIDAVVMGALWVEIRAFPWRRRTRAYAKSLLLDTRAAVLRLLLPSRTRSGDDPIVLVQPSSLVDRAVDLDGGSGVDEARTELLDLLGWAVSSSVVTADDVAVLLELVAAGDARSDQGQRMRPGLCTQAAVAAVAHRRGLSAKTVVRHRDRVVAALRDAKADYVAQVA